MKYFLYFLIIYYSKQNLPIKKICKSELDFNNANKELLNNQSLYDFFSTKEILNKGNSSVIIQIKIKQKDYIIKRVKIKNLEEIKDNLSKEINILDQIKGNPHLIEYLDCIYNLQKNLIYIIKEKLYKNLEKKIFKKKSTKQKLNFYIQIAEGLLELHELGYIHNDLKPENIMVTNKNYSNPKLINFKLAAKIDEISQGGTLLFIPYEKLVNQIVVANPSIDVNSFAVTIASLELGNEELIREVRKSWGLTKNGNWRDYHARLAERLFWHYPRVLDHSNFFVRSWRYFLGLFLDNRKDRIYDFRDFMNNMMDNNSENRLELNDCVDFLIKFRDLHENSENFIEDINPNEKIDISDKSLIMMTKTIINGEDLENIKDSVNLIEDSKIMIIL